MSSSLLSLSFSSLFNSQALESSPSSSVLEVRDDLGFWGFFFGGVLGTASAFVVWEFVAKGWGIWDLLGFCLDGFLVCGFCQEWVSATWFTLAFVKNFRPCCSVHGSSLDSEENAPSFFLRMKLFFYVFIFTGL